MSVIYASIVRSETLLMPLVITGFSITHFLVNT